MMMLNTKTGVALLAFCGLAMSSAASDHENNKNKVGRKRNLRNRKAQRFNIPNEHANMNKNDEDLTEDVRFWTRTLQNGSMPPTPNTPQPTRRPVTRRPTTPNPTDQNNPDTPSPTVVTIDTPAPVPDTPAPVPDTPAPVPVTSTVPVARPDSVTIAPDDLAFIDVLGNDTPAPGEELQVRAIETQGSNGECTISVDLTQVVYVPVFGFSGSDSCVYEACDGVPVCATATVSITVGGGNLVQNQWLPMPDDIPRPANITVEEFNSP